jgi:hypothetical protein
MSLAHQIRPALPAAPKQGALPVSYEAAKTALANCASVDECKDWSDKAAALAAYAKQAEDLELERMAVRIRARAIRRAGELLKQIEPGHGKNQNITDAADSKVLTRTEAARQAGMSERQQVTAVRVANVPAADFEEQVQSPNPPTLTTLAQQGTQRREGLDPETWLKGRDPAAFNKAMHFVGLVEEYAKDVGRADLDTILPNLDERQAARVRSAIAAIDPIHDTVVTRL